MTIHTTVAQWHQQWHHIYIYNESKHAKTKEKKKYFKPFTRLPQPSHAKGSIQYNDVILPILSHLMPRGRFNIMMSSYQYRKSHSGDKTLLQLFYLHYGISYTGKKTSLYRIRAQVSIRQPCWWSRSWQSNHFIPGNCTLDPSGIWTMK